MEIVKNFFARKKIGFYIGAGCAILSLLCSIVYVVGFSPSGVLGDYTSYWVFVLTLFGFLSFVGLSFFKQTSSLAAPVMGFFGLIALIFFALNGYLYFAEVFYGAFNLAGFFGMNPAYLFCLFSLIFILILSSVCIYLKQEKEDSVTTTSEVNV